MGHRTIYENTHERNTILFVSQVATRQSKKATESITLISRYHPQVQ